MVNAHASFNVRPVAVSFEDVEFLDKSNKSSTIGIQFEAEEVIYGAEAVLKKLLASFPKILGGASEEQVF